MDRLPAEGTKKKILEASIDLFSRKGYSAVSVRELTKAVGIKESSLYNHFRSKEEILESIYQMFKAERDLALPSKGKLSFIAKNTSIETFLLQGMESFKRSVEDELHEKMWRILNIEQFRDQRARDIILNQVYKGTIDFLEHAFQAFMDENKMKQSNARLLAIQYQYPIFTMMTEYLLLKYDDKDTADVENKMQGHLQFFLHNLHIY
ncbi:TetR/AcrR family transcriptional regulator [Niallia endozanthoxylica]|uniref:TetR/AcrR family transcriptional regulator n=1 Tax=Niallia endozanthoxylica TaxID=2036016 RepID=A0A5J5I1Z4_9BACI|nr:TetR/AcrR family transcriptional regulator [Niallia endozanthoxylica]KAA9028549.1 TetR/AcrR family transcriptional regulator [Niallia endozanthoxylica]